MRLWPLYSSLWFAHLPMKASPYLSFSRSLSLQAPGIFLRVFCIRCLYLGMCVLGARSPKIPQNISRWTTSSGKFVLWYAEVHTACVGAPISSWVATRATISRSSLSSARAVLCCLSLTSIYCSAYEYLLYELCKCLRIPDFSGRDSAVGG